MRQDTTGREVVGMRRYGTHGRAPVPRAHAARNREHTARYPVPGPRAHAARNLAAVVAAVLLAVLGVLAPSAQATVP
ncbi:hypothetical protein AB0N23_29595, partial [Streptomyces sp. NPDC052644]